MGKWLKGAALTIAIGAAVIGLHRIRRPEDTAIGALWFAIAILLSIIASTSASPLSLKGPEAPLTSSRPKQILGYGLLALAGLLGGFSLRLFSKEQGLLPWAFYWLSVIAFGTSFYLLEESSPTGDKGGSRASSPVYSGYIFCLILLLAAFLRLYRIDSMPPGIYYDEANNALDALWTIETGKHPIYFEGWGGRGPLIMYSLATAFRLLGRSPLALRLVPVFYGLAGVVAIYLLARTFWGWETALIAAFLLAVMRWHAHFSRVAFDAITVPCFTGLSLHFLGRALTRGRRTDYMWAGFFLGWGLMGYAAFRVVPLLALIILGWIALRRRLTLAQIAQGGLIFLAAALIASAPLLFYAARHPKAFTARSKQVYLLRFYPPSQRLSALLRNVRCTLLMFHQRGDNNARHNLPDAPMLDPVMGVLLVLGVGTSLRRIGDWRHLGVLAWFALALQPGIWSIEAPQALRNIGVVAPIVLMCATFLDDVMQMVGGRRPIVNLGKLKPLTPLPLIALLGAIAILNYNFYFYHQALEVRGFYAFYGVETTIGRLVASLGTDYRFYSIYSGDPTVRFLSPPDIDHQFLNPVETLPLREPVDKDVLYIVDPRYDPPEVLFHHWYPEARVKELMDPAGKVMLKLIEVEAEAINHAQGLRTRYYAGGKLIAERVEKTLDVQPPPHISPPLTVEKEGSIFIPQTGTYRLSLQADAPSLLFISGPAEAVRLHEGEEAEVELVKGWHNLRLHCQVEEEGQQITVQISGPPELQEPVSSQFFNLHKLLRQGLRGYYYKGAEWQWPPVFSRIDPFVSFRWHIQPVPAPFSVEWCGYLVIEKPGLYGFALFSNALSYVELDGKTLLRSSSEKRQETELYLERGEHPITIRYSEPGGYSAIRFYWKPPGGKLEVVPMEALRPCKGERWSGR